MAAQKPTLYFITTELPWPANSGGRIKTFRLLQFLSIEFEVRLACAYGAKDAQSLTLLRQESGIASVQVFGELKQRNALSWFQAIAQFPTFNSFRVYSKKMESVIRWGIEQADVTMVDHLEMLEMIPQKLMPNVIYHSHNAEFKLWAEFAELSSNPIKRWLLEWEASRVGNFERWAIKKSKFTFAAPNDSALAIEKWEIPANKFRLTYHLGDDSLLEKPAIDIEQNQPRVFFCGTLSWMPNRDGITWFVKNVWPGVIAQAKDAELVVCGGGADEDLVKILRQGEGVSYLGYVDDLDAEMAKSRCAIVPLRFGSGMKIKTFDALYRGLPLISSSAGVDGIESGDDYATVCDSIEQWVDAVVNIVTDAKSASLLARSARKMIKEKYTYQSIFPLMLIDIKQSMKEID